MRKSETLRCRVTVVIDTGIPVTKIEVTDHLPHPFVTGDFPALPFAVFPHVSRLEKPFPSILSSLPKGKKTISLYTMRFSTERLCLLAKKTHHLVLPFCSK